MQHWGDCISYARFGFEASGSQSVRSEFTRDYDRIIFLSAFRRLQNKTQVFPLPGNVFVHNRLTHSLEVASVGRSLGSIIGQELNKKHRSTFTEDQCSFYQYELSGVISSACLAHDLGNPAFGHSGEKAISHFFISHADQQLNNSNLKSHFKEHEWSDLINFEGNANALRLLTRQFKGKLEGGQRLMYVTLASILKYPCSSDALDKKYIHRKKYGYFQSDKKAFDDIVERFDMIDQAGRPYRHPFVYLVEAADDICYRIIDMEDAHRIGILSRIEIEHAFLSLIGELIGQNSTLDRTKDVLNKISDDNEAISYLRAKCINGLVSRATEVFLNNEEEILSGHFNSTLVDEVAKSCHYLSTINEISVTRIYNHHSVIEVELAGYNVMSEILSVFINAVLNENRTALENKCLHLIPTQYNLSKDDVSPYEKTMGVLDFVSGMTDGYATEMYRKMKGIDIPSHK
ncbi:MAG: dNTP triphosphohydrolase [Saprospiraceae bacterium]|nr:dNTP triphosphohydrolase [Saprospiraceae bacterium]